jgi:hypothetical protein
MKSPSRTKEPEMSTMTAPNPTTEIYRSESYLVISNDYGVEVTRVKDRTSEWLRGSKADHLRGVLEFAGDAGMSADAYLSKYFFI